MKRLVFFAALVLAGCASEPRSEPRASAPHAPTEVEAAVTKFTEKLANYRFADRDAAAFDDHVPRAHYPCVVNAAGEPIEMPDLETELAQRVCGTGKLALVTEVPGPWASSIAFSIVAQVDDTSSRRAIAIRLVRDATNEVLIASLSLPPG